MVQAPLAFWSLLPRDSRNSNNLLALSPEVQFLAMYPQSLRTSFSLFGSNIHTNSTLYQILKYVCHMANAPEALQHSFPSSNLSLVPH